MTQNPKLSDLSPACLFGAAPDTGNQGVTALCQSAVLGLHERGVGPLTVFDHGRGSRREAWQLGEEKLDVIRQGAVNGRRLYRPENLRQAQIAQKLGGLGNPILRRIRQFLAVLDVSGGDSFSDIYGESRFDTVTTPKRLTLAENVPLILLPQTYGPFAGEGARLEASRIIGASTLAFARDGRSFAAMKALLGASFDPKRHKLGVDMAFGLPATEVSQDRLGSAVTGLLQAPRKRPLIGLNVSGLLFNHADWAKAQFSLSADYRKLMRLVLAQFLAATPANVILLPHVHQPLDHFESDLAACLALREALPSSLRQRVAIPVAALDAAEAKWLIAQCDWFAGSRMHATIAALSSGVPAVALAYSGKMQGVFECCGQASSVLDLRGPLSPAEIAQAMLHLFSVRQATARHLRLTSARVRGQACAQMDEIAAFIRARNARAEAA